MIYENSIIQLLNINNENLRLIRVCWISNDAKEAAVVDISDSKKMTYPYFMSMEELLEDLSESKAIKLDYEPDLQLINPPEEYALKYAEKVNSKWSLIEDLVSTEPEIYVPEARWKLVLEVSDNKNIGINVIYDLLKRYWFYGKSINGLLPNYFGCGAKGEPRQYKKTTIKCYKNSFPVRKMAFIHLFR